MAQKRRITTDDLGTQCAGIERRAELTQGNKRLRFERGEVVNALRETGGNVRNAAELLTIHRQQLQRLIRRYRIDRTNLGGWTPISEPARAASVADDATVGSRTELSRAQVVAALAESGGNVSVAARACNVHRRKFQRLLRRYHIFPHPSPEVLLNSQKEAIRAIAEKDRARRQQVIDALSGANGNVSMAAETLGVSRQHFYRLMARYNLTPHDYRVSPAGAAKSVTRVSPRYVTSGEPHAVRDGGT
jgi:transcriptional regulator of acetoin/glycerol metabolism